MALKDILNLIDDKLADVFHHVQPDPAKLRKPFLSGLKKTRDQFGEGRQPRGERKWWTANNGVVCFTPNVDGTPVKIANKHPVYVPQERFPDFLTGLETACNAGELDDQWTGTGQAKPRKRGPSPLAGRGWSEARRKAHEAAKKTK